MTVKLVQRPTPRQLTRRHADRRQFPGSNGTTYLAAVAIEHGKKTRRVRVTEVQRHDMSILLRYHTFEYSRVTRKVANARGMTEMGRRTPRRHSKGPHVPCRGATPASLTTRTSAYHSLPWQTPWRSPERSDNFPFGHVYDPRRHSAGYRVQSETCPVHPYVARICRLYYVFFLVIIGL